MDKLEELFSKHICDSGNYGRVESSLSNPLAARKGFHDCNHNHSLTNVRDLKDPVSFFDNSCSHVLTKIQQTKMLVTCQRFGDLLLFGLVWQYSSVQTKYNKGRLKVMATYLQQ